MSCPHLRARSRSGGGRRGSRISATTSASSRSRPINGVACGGRFVGRFSRRRQWREVPLEAFCEELEDLLRTAQVLQAMLAEIEESELLGQIVLDQLLARSARPAPARRGLRRRCERRGGRPSRRTPRPSAAARPCGSPSARGSGPAASTRCAVRRRGDCIAALARRRRRTRRPACRPRRRRGARTPRAGRAGAPPAPRRSRRRARRSSRVEPSMSVKRKVTVPRRKLAHASMIRQKSAG